MHFKIRNTQYAPKIRNPKHPLTKTANPNPTWETGCWVGIIQPNKIIFMLVSDRIKYCHPYLADVILEGVWDLHIPKWLRQIAFFISYIGFWSVWDLHISGLFYAK